ncbi:MAG: hypothetical protein HRT74_05905 [Flavobacteriales bacterium]|nr:hypothetical protein [Flavobacteriales bacterium]
MKPLHLRVSSLNDDTVLVVNNLQRKNEVLSSTKTGLSNINNRYKLINSREIEVSESIEEFKVKVPLLEINHYADHHS